ncbi:hypothetical protein [Brumicola nitratireducens]|uniref:Uncharacterized protein n=1 Tax=Glaciecola nitratireducens (strain JCM 12485 / KCTC 12276 / FR1064) TaxID=1085623 RepID=G4QM70_GLANF|nr:hypothetical protein [Glaciecola nitratireducens]AEP30641.1 hypothetical protein GNIT_2544 [Glaciecola nitratireducens FR1064]
MKIFEKRLETNARTCIYVAGIKIFTYKAKDIVQADAISYIKSTQESYRLIEASIKNKVSNGRTVNITFMVNSPSMFPGKPLFASLLKNNSFYVNLLVIPDLRYGLEHANENQKRTIEALKEFSDRIKVAPVEEKEDDTNICELADILFLPTPYDISHNKYNLKSLIKLNILPAMINYGFFRSIYDRDFLISRPMYSLYWKVFLETNYNVNEFKRFSLINGTNTKLVGYCKMDGYKQKRKKKQKEKPF